MMKGLKQKYFLWLMALLMHVAAHSQTNCKDIDLNSIPGKWVWQKKRDDVVVPAAAWGMCEPIRKELQRIMPQPVEGIIATNFISPTGSRVGDFNKAKGSSAYINAVMVKDYECIMVPNAKVNPAPVTACWIYFNVNYWSTAYTLSSCGDIGYTEYPSDLYNLNIWFETDANGNQIMYTSPDKETTQMESYFFTPKNRLPFRKLTRKELFKCYKVYHEKRLKKKIDEMDQSVAKQQADYNKLSPAEKKNQAYMIDVMANNKKTLDGFKAERERMISWYSVVSNQPNLNDTAYAEQVSPWDFEPEKLDAAPGKGRPVWIDDISFYDKTKPVDQPQCIFFRIKREDRHLVKKNFMDKFYNEFNLDVLCKMVGMAPKKPGGINNLSGAIKGIKQESYTNQTAVSAYSYNFENTKAGTFPSGWDGMNNIQVNSFKGSNWLAMTADGYWHPKQYNKEIKNGFDLSFDVSWNPDINYYSGYFTVTLSEMAYDNAQQRYNTEGSSRMYRSMYDSYGGNFNRVVIMFDPHWNNGGNLYIYSYNAGEVALVEKKILLPHFYKEKNNHRLSIERKGSNLVITDNEKEIVSIENVFIATAKYNLYTFSRYMGDKYTGRNDIFYLNNVSARY